MKNYLLTPGPTPVPAEALEAMAGPIIHHRTPQFRDILKDVEEGLRYVFKTENPVMIFSASGTGAMEGAVSNLLSSGDRAIVVRGGKFGERWAEICTAYGVEVIAVDVEWGNPPDPEDIEKALKESQGVKAVYVTLCETSTGVATDVKRIAGITGKTDAVLVVDAISALGAVPLETDAWGVDVVVSGSQKGLMIPPGLAFVAMSKKAWKLTESSNLPKYYFDFKKYKKTIEKNDTPYTPAVNLVIGLREALRLIKEEGIDNLISRHQRNSRAVREAMKAIGLELFAPSAYSEAVTAVKVPDGIDGAELVKTMRDEYGVAIAGGQGKLKGRIFRIATMGYIREDDLKVCVSTLEAVLEKMGYKFGKGKAIETLNKLLSAQGNGS
jgi:aspartate aminotransferase-like enzyme